MWILNDNEQLLIHLNSAIDLVSLLSPPLPLLTKDHFHSLAARHGSNCVQQKWGSLRNLRGNRRQHQQPKGKHFVYRTRNFIAKKLIKHISHFCYKVAKKSQCGVDYLPWRLTGVSSFLSATNLTLWHLNGMSFSAHHPALHLSGFCWQKVWDLLRQE